MWSDVKFVAGLCLAALLWLVAGLYTAWFAHDMLSPESACQRATPWFEGLQLEHVEIDWLPPTIHCTVVDTDPGQVGERSTFTPWETGDLVFVIVLDALAVGEGARRIVRMRRRHHREFVAAAEAPA